MIEFITEYWVHILIGFAFIAGLILFAVNQRKNIIEWLLYVVMVAEKELGSKTGKIKLRQVYNDFVVTFPVISKIITFSTFSGLVDVALVEMKKILATNAECKKFVEGEEV